MSRCLSLRGAPWFAHPREGGQANEDRTDRGRRFSFSAETSERVQKGCGGRGFGQAPDDPRHRLHSEDPCAAVLEALRRPVNSRNSLARAQRRDGSTVARPSATQRNPARPSSTRPAPSTTKAFSSTPQAAMPIRWLAHLVDASRKNARCRHSSINLCTTVICEH